MMLQSIRFVLQQFDLLLVAGGLPIVAVVKVNGIPAVLDENPSEVFVKCWNKMLQSLCFWLCSP